MSTRSFSGAGDFSALTSQDCTLADVFKCSVYLKVRASGPISEIFSYTCFFWPGIWSCGFHDWALGRIRMTCLMKTSVLQKPSEVFPVHGSNAIDEETESQ